MNPQLSSSFGLPEPKWSGSRSEVSRHLEAIGHRYQRNDLGRGHIFYALLSHIMKNGGCEGDRLYFHYEFAKIERIVQSARAGDLAAGDRLATEVRRARSSSIGSVSDPFALDALLLPACALIELERSETEMAVTMLREAIGCLSRYRDAGCADAEVAVLEQELNILRALSREGVSSRFVETVFAFVVQLRWRRPYRRPTDADDHPIPDIAEVIDHYVDAALLKAMATLPREDLAKLLWRIAGALPNETNSHAFATAASACADLLTGSKVSRAEPGSISAEMFPLIPAPLVIIFDAATCDGRGKTDVEDGLIRALKSYTGHEMIRATVHEFFGYDRPSLTPDIRTVINL